MVPSASAREWTRIPVLVRYVPGSRTSVAIAALPQVDLRVALRKQCLERDTACRDPLVPLVDAVARAVRRGAMTHHDRADPARCRSEMVWRATPKLDESRHSPHFSPMQRMCDVHLNTRVTT